jgi:hypothetical protein
MAIRSAFILSLTAALLGGTAASSQNRDSGDIIVTATPLSETARLLADCIARNCPPAEDIAATLRHAENQFVAGDYDESRATMSASLRRNRADAAAVPVELSSLYRAHGRVSAHLGDSRTFQLSTLSMRDTLRRNLATDDFRTLAADIEVADSRRALGYPLEARDIYLRTARRAEAAGAHRVAAFARLRLATQDLPGADDPPYQRTTRSAREAVANLTTITGQADSAGADMALMAEILLARFERDGGDMRRTDALVQRFAAGNGATRPLLIAGDPILLNNQGRSRELIPDGALRRLQNSDVTDRWIDVGFWVEADGRIGNFEVLRSSGDPQPWANAVQESVESRRYAPLQLDRQSGAPGFYMVERYTLTAQIRFDCTGTRISCRDTELRVERMDLTPDMPGGAPQTRVGR